MAVTDLNNPRMNIDTSNDNVVIVDVFQTVRGGRSLDVTGFTQPVINAGHIIIKEGNEYKPMPVNADGTAYEALPEGASYAGVLINTILKTKAMASILVRGTVNPAASSINLSAILADVKTALPLIDFRED